MMKLKDVFNAVRYIGLSVNSSACMTGLRLAGCQESLFGLLVAEAAKFLVAPAELHDTGVTVNDRHAALVPAR